MREACTLFVVCDDIAGSINALARELRRRGHMARVVSLAPDERLGYPMDLHASIDGGRELMALAASCTRLHLVDCQFSSLGPWGQNLRGPIESGQVQLSMQFDGALTPALARQERLAWPDLSLDLWATRPALASALSVDFLPPYLPVERPGYQPISAQARARQAKNLKARFFFAGRTSIAGSSVEALIDRWEQDAGGMREVEILQRQPHARVLARRRHAHVTACGGADYLQRSTLEALAAGLRVVSPWTGEWLSAYSDLAQGEPAPLLDLPTFEAKLPEMRAHQEPDLKAAAWARKVLCPRRWLQRFGVSPQDGRGLAA